MLVLLSLVHAQRIVRENLEKKNRRTYSPTKSLRNETADKWTDRVTSRDSGHVDGHFVRTLV